MKKYLAVIALLPLIGCGMSNATRAEYQTAIASCKKDFPNKKVLLLNCKFAARDRFGVSIPAESLIRATNLSIAAKVDQGLISEADGRLLIERETLRINQEVARTEAANRVAQAASDAEDTAKQEILNRQMCIANANRYATAGGILHGSLPRCY